MVRILLEMEGGIVKHVFSDQAVEVVVRDNDVISNGEDDRETFMEGEFNPHVIADVFGEAFSPPKVQLG